MEARRFLEVSHTSPERARVLVVDDDAELAETLAGVLRESGLAVDIAGDASQGVRAARRTKPGVVVVDLGMPDIDGWAVIRAIRAARLARRPHIIVMSGFTDARSRQRAFEAGCDQYIVKDAGTDAIVSAVRTYLVRLNS